MGRSIFKLLHIHLDNLQKWFGENAQPPRQKHPLFRCAEERTISSGGIENLIVILEDT